MANKINISDEANKKKLNVDLRKIIQSANLNFLIGSGCSFPAINPLGNIEREIDVLRENGKELDAEICMFDFLQPIAESNNKLIEADSDSNTLTTLNNYKEFLQNIFEIMIKRKSNILTKHTTIFNSNYDLFIEKASEEFGSTLKINDGFNRNPKLDNLFKFFVTEFFNVVYNKGNLYNYQVEVPSINLIKLHGSLSWGRLEKDIVFLTPNYLEKFEDKILEYAESNGFEEMCKYVKEFNNQFQVILPTKEKLRDTLLNRIYYNLLRIYANELDKENTLLIAEGISQKALRNPTLKLIIFCCKEGEVGSYEKKFSRYKNVDIVFSEKGNLEFEEFNSIIKDVLSQDISQAQDVDVPQEEANNAE